MPITTCNNCGIEFKHGHSSTGKFCSTKCSGEHRYKISKQKWLDGGKIGNRNTIRQYLIDDRGDICEVCGISEYNGMPITLQVDHIDGNAGDDRPSNVRLICPNCHSQTEFYGAKNKGNGRAARGLPLF